MLITQHIITLLIVSYILGSIPFGLLAGKIFKRVDIRNFGSGNIGVTNVVRVMGKKWGAFVLFFDVLKGIIPVLLAKLYFFGLYGDLIPIIAGFTAVLGHIFPIWLKFKGGKGFATTIGVLFALDWRLAVCLLLVWVIVFKLSKISALAALISIMITTLLSTFISSFEVMMACTVLCIIIIIRHKSNIVRIWKGEEHSFKKWGK
jgi:glycerol-3-phosphate acyltransferase PlsY